MAISRHALFGKLNLILFKAIESATALCKLRGNAYVEIVHWLHQLMLDKDTDLHHVMAACGIDSQDVMHDLAAALDALPSGADKVSDFSPEVETAIERAWMCATMTHQMQSIRSACLMQVLLQEEALRRVVLSVSGLFAKIDPAFLEKNMQDICRDSVENASHAYDKSDMQQALPGQASGAWQPQQEQDVLGCYCTDLTMQAAAGKLDPVMGRQTEIRACIDILLRRRQNNVLVTGEAGVGKTALAEGLAQAIAGRNVPQSLQDVRLLSLDVGALLAGASMKGEFESRLKKVLQAISASGKPAILFIDEIHTLVGAGGEAGTADAINLLKPALSRGGLQVIGATTWSEYRKHLEKDAAFTRRFQLLRIEAPDADNAIPILRAIAGLLETHHKVSILDEAVQAAVSLSMRFLPDRQLPDKAICLLDTACARVRMSAESEPAVLQDARVALAYKQDEWTFRQDKVHMTSDRAEIAMLEEQMHTLRERVDLLASQWQQECSLVEELRGITDARHEAEHASDAFQKKGDALAALQENGAMVHPYVSRDVIAGIIEDWTGIPACRMLKEEAEQLSHLHAVMQQQVIGQALPLQVLCDQIMAARCGLSDPGKPAGVFLLAGPSGVGKTETALAIARSLFGSEEHMVTVNMSEYQEAHTVSSLKGAPPGYVGYGEGGVLTEAVRKRPYSVILLDEIEKAHPDVHELFFQVFDKGWMEDGNGRRIDFSHSIIILTSNAASHLLAGVTEIDRQGYDALQETLRTALLQVFPAAFIGRVSVVPYLALSVAHLRQIMQMQLDKIIQRMQQHQVSLTFAASVTDHVVSMCAVSDTGARMLMDVINRKVLPVVSRAWLEMPGRDQAGNALHVDVCDGAIRCGWQQGLVA